MSLRRLTMIATLSMLLMSSAVQHDDQQTPITPGSNDPDQHLATSSKSAPGLPAATAACAQPAEVAQPAPAAGTAEAEACTDAEARAAEEPPWMPTLRRARAMASGASSASSWVVVSSEEEDDPLVEEARQQAPSTPPLALQEAAMRAAQTSSASSGTMSSEPTAVYRGHGSQLVPLTPELRNHRIQRIIARLSGLPARRAAEWLCQVCGSTNWEGQHLCRSCLTQHPGACPLIPGAHMALLPWSTWEDTHSQIRAYNMQRPGRRGRGSNEGKDTTPIRLRSRSRCRADARAATEENATMASQPCVVAHAGGEAQQAQPARPSSAMNTPTVAAPPNHLQHLWCLGLDAILTWASHGSAMRNLPRQP